MIKYETNVKNGVSVKLELYLESRNIGRKEFAEMIGVCPATISNYIHFKRKPTLKIGRMIEKITKGNVLIDDLLEFWEEKKNK
jgi:predicted transcriptional regulator